VHSALPIKLNVEECDVKKDYDYMVNQMILQNWGEEFEQTDSYRVVSKFYEPSYSFAFGILNLSGMELEFTLDCTTSKNMVFSDPAGQVTKLIEPGELAFMMHSEAAPGCEEFARGVECSFKQLY